MPWLLEVLGERGIWVIGVLGVGTLWLWRGIDGEFDSEKDRFGWIVSFPAGIVISQLLYIVQRFA